MLLICWVVLCSTTSEMGGKCQRKCFSAVSRWCYRSSSKPELHIERKPLRFKQHVLHTDCEWFYSAYDIYVWIVHIVCVDLYLCVCVDLSELQIYRFIFMYSWFSLAAEVDSSFFLLKSLHLISPCRWEDEQQEICERLDLCLLLLL